MTLPTYDDVIDAVNAPSIDQPTYPCEDFDKGLYLRPTGAGRVVQTRHHEAHNPYRRPERVLQWAFSPMTAPPKPVLRPSTGRAR